MRIKIESNAKQVKAGFKTIATEMPKTLKRDLLRAVEWAKERISGHWPSGSKQGYTIPFTPAQAKGEKGAYVRTEKLGAGWMIKPVPSKQAYVLENKVPYTPFVSGNAYGRNQAAIHAGRWPIAFKVLTTAVDVVLRQYLKVSLRDVIRKAGFSGGEAAGL